jgi:hypothetical protein
LRVLVACVAFGLLFAPPARAIASTDGIAWIAGARAAAHAERSDTEASSKTVREASPSRVAPEPILDQRDRAALPMGARATIVRSRLYLLHAALLR